jgi:hypothetical protein
VTTVLKIGTLSEREVYLLLLEHLWYFQGKFGNRESVR